MQAQKIINTLKENNQKHKYEVFEMLVWGNFDWAAPLFKMNPSC